MTTYANRVAKTAGLLADEHDLVRGQVIRIDLPSHWLARSSRRRLDRRAGGDPGRRRGRLRLWSGRPRPVGQPGREVVVLAGAPASAPGSPTRSRQRDDSGVEVWSQPDAWVAFDPPGPTTSRSGTPPRPSCGPRPPPAMSSPTAAGSSPRRTRLPRPGSSFLEPLVRGGSLVLVAHADPARLDATYAAERATIRYPSA